MPQELRGQGIHNNPNNQITIEGLQPDMVQDDELEFGEYYEVLHDIGLAPGGVPHPVDYVQRPKKDNGERNILKMADFGVTEKEQKEKIERLLRLGAIKATKAPKSEKAKREDKARA